MLPFFFVGLVWCWKIQSYFSLFSLWTVLWVWKVWNQRRDCFQMPLMCQCNQPRSEAKTLYRFPVNFAPFYFLWAPKNGGWTTPHNLFKPYFFHIYARPICLHSYINHETVYALKLPVICFVDSTCLVFSSVFVFRFGYNGFLKHSVAFFRLAVLEFIFFCMG